jgi:hypothetical protein
VKRYSVDWPAHGGHRVYNTRAEAQAHALRVKLGRGEDAIITEIQDEPPAQTFAGHSTPAQSLVTSQTTVPVQGPARVPVAASSDGKPPAGGLPPSAEGWGITPPEIDAVLALLERDEDLRIARHAARIREYRKRNAAGVYRWPRHTRTSDKETGF